MMTRLARKIYLWGLLGSFLLLTVYLFYSNALNVKSETVPSSNVNRELLYSRHLEQEIKQDHNPRYVIGLNYWEQMSMAIGNMFALSSMSDSLHAKLVEPFTCNSRLYGLPHFLSDHKWREIEEESLSLSTIFNINHINTLSESYGLSQLIDFNTFINVASRSVVLIHFIHKRESREQPIKGLAGGVELIRNLGNSYVLECNGYKAVQSLVQTILSSLNKETRGMNQFSLIKHCCINGSHETTPLELAERCGFDPQNGALTLLVLNWRGVTGGPNVHRSAKGLHKSQRLILKNSTSLRHPKGITDPFIHSDKILQLSRDFMKQLQLLSGEYISVHVRSEKLGQRDRRVGGFLDNCLNKAWSLATNISRGQRLIVFSDFGPQGSDSCYSCKGGKKVKSFFEMNNITRSSFNPDLYSTRSDTGIIAAVEMETIVSSKTAVLVGGGMYERQIVLLRQMNKNNKVIKICWDDSGIIENYDPNIRRI